ncbi:hypothetical protein HK101_002640 [Irineochytrium annulatum]|nr:hypothetical protein HK101_002640 [Irineochytrium annulatum]
MLATILLAVAALAAPVFSTPASSDPSYYKPICMKSTNFLIFDPPHLSLGSGGYFDTNCTVRLAVKPTGPVTVYYHSVAVKFDVNVHVFDESSWEMPQTLSVIPTPDFLGDSSQTTVTIEADVDAPCEAWNGCIQKYTGTMTKYPSETCVITGDPHVQTFDGVTVLLNKMGKFHYVQSPYLNVQGYTYPCVWGVGSTPAACTGAVAIAYGSSAVILSIASDDYKSAVTNKKPPAPHLKKITNDVQGISWTPDDGSSSDDWKFKLDDGSSIEVVINWDAGMKMAWMDVHIALSGAYYGKVGGICNVHDRSSGGHLKCKGGQLVSTAIHEIDTWCSSWLVSEAESLFHGAVTGCQHPMHKTYKPCTGTKPATWRSYCRTSTMAMATTTVPAVITTRPAMTTTTAVVVPVVTTTTAFVPVVSTYTTAIPVVSTTMSGSVPVVYTTTSAAVMTVTSSSAMVVTKTTTAVVMTTATVPAQTTVPVQTTPQTYMTSTAVATITTTPIVTSTTCTLAQYTPSSYTYTMTTPASVTVIPPTYTPSAPPPHYTYIPISNPSNTQNYTIIVPGPANPPATSYRPPSASDITGAEAHCKAIMSAPGCESVCPTQHQVYLTACVADILSTGSYAFCETTRRAWNNLCASVSSYIVAGPDAGSGEAAGVVAVMNGHGENECPSSCSGHGTCVSYGCKCDAPFTGADCSVDQSALAYVPPPCAAAPESGSGMSVVQVGLVAGGNKAPDGYTFSNPGGLEAQPAANVSTSAGGMPGMMGGMTSMAAAANTVVGNQGGNIVKNGAERSAAGVVGLFGVVVAVLML